MIFNKHRRYQWQNAAMTVLAIGAFSLCHAIDFKCSNQDDFYYAVPDKRCSSYYRCSAQKTKTLHECAPESKFDFYKQTCSRAPGICYEPVCTGRVDGHYPDTTHACRRSFQCKSGHLVSIDNCPYGQLFSGHSCTAQDFVTCELPQSTSIAYPFSGDRRCMGLSNGVYAAPNTNCARYITCDNQEVIKDTECADGYKYDDSVKQCRPADQVKSCSAASDKLCVGLPNGYSHDPMSTTCKSYLKCHDQKLISREFCSSQAVFNGNLCVPQPLYECPSAVAEIAGSREMCHGKTNGLYSDPRRGCGAYVKCAQGKTVESSECSQNYYFDPHGRRCVYEKALNKRKCQEPIASKPISNAPAEKCLMEKIVFGQICTLVLAIVGTVVHRKRTDTIKTKVPAVAPISTVQEVISIDIYAKMTKCSMGQRVFHEVPDDDCQDMNECVGKTDGYYHHIESNCRKYFFCLKQEVVTTLTCRGSKVFNGHKCVPVNEFTCPRFGDEDLQNCVPRTMCHKQCKANGFYADLDSGCRKYHFCIANNKSVLSCAEGLLFNGEICVPEEQYTCPKYCTDVITDSNACLE
ncbi:hypothetical protein HA402_004921 [Bradysia odoriphaga]|nr:hypothetical protein HA402_004921 [Bradysia odoriphaga]